MDGAAVDTSHAFSDRQSKSHTARIPIARIGHSIERPENVGQLGGGNTRSVVRYADEHRTGVVMTTAFKVNVDGSTRSGVPNGVAGDVLHGAPEQLRVR